MLKFSENYFNKEARDGFTISPTMKHAFASQLELLEFIKNVCVRYNIKYYAFWGTLLGAVRHGGFIPWDDDIDIAMLRPDYNRFLQAIASEAPDYFCINNVHRTPEYTNTFTRITNSSQINISDQFLEHNHGCPFIVGIDIFPLDNLSDDPEKLSCQMEIFEIVRSLISLANYVESSDCPLEFKETTQSEIHLGLKDLKDFFCITNIDDRPILNQLRIIYDYTCMMYADANSSLITSFPEYISGKSLVFNREHFTPLTHNFENTEIIIPNGYDEILTTLFGDYMVPVIGSGDHEYPFYRYQLQLLHDRGLWLDVDE